MKSKIVRTLGCLLALTIAFGQSLPTGKGYTDVIAQGGADPFCGMQFATGDDLATVRSLGVTVVLQTFRHDDGPEEWLAQLDLAQSHGLQVIGWLYWPEGWEWDGAAWQISDQARLFVQTMASHPATFAVYALHEPYWRDCPTCGLTTAQQQALYQEIKAIADVLLYSEIGSIAFWVDQGPVTALADGVCDYCAVGYYPFSADGTYHRDEFISYLDRELASIRGLAPNSKLVWLLQIFAVSDYAKPRRMPTAEEIADVGAIVAERDVDGIFWYVWEFGPYYVDFLSNHPELFPAVASVPACARTVPTTTSVQVTTAPATRWDTPTATVPLSPSPTSSLPTDTVTSTAVPSPAATPSPMPTVKTPQNQMDRHKDTCGLVPLLGFLSLVRFGMLVCLGKRSKSHEPCP